MKNHSYCPRAPGTGGVRFVDSQLCDRLVTNSQYFICLNNFFAGIKGAILQLLDNPHCGFIRQKAAFTLYVEVNEVFNRARLAYLIHYEKALIQAARNRVVSASNMPELAAV